MISFKLFEQSSFEECFSYVAEKLSAAGRDELREIFGSLSDMADECEIGVTSYGGCLLIRMYDEGYFFVYPIAMTDSADAI